MLQFILIDLSYSNITFFSGESCRSNFSVVNYYTGITGVFMLVDNSRDALMQRPYKVLVMVM